ncbi:MAG: cytochrome P460 family protein [Acidobacteriota bacterium]|nr:cytochrome P460 family protein [Acidobacteriota bacterium]
MKRILGRVVGLVLIVVGTIALFWQPTFHAAASDNASQNAPRYTSDNKLVAPANYRDWNYLSSGLGMTYSKSGPEDHPMFTNVYATPEAYHAFLKTGEWPDKTMLVMEEYSSGTEGSINQGGHYQLALMGIEAHVKDSARPGDLWKFYGFDDGGTPADARGNGNACTKCHTKNGGVEDTFVQFYPTLLPVARAKGTLRPGTDVAAKK